LLSLDKKFRASAEDIVSVIAEVAPKRDYHASGERPRWEPAGKMHLATDAGVYVLDWDRTMYNAAEYVVRAVATRKNGPTQEARGLASSPAY
jgi:hypothetical protein